MNCLGKYQRRRPVERRFGNRGVVTNGDMGKKYEEKQLSVSSSMDFLCIRLSAYRLFYLKNPFVPWRSGLGSNANAATDGLQVTVDPVLGQAANAEYFNLSPLSGGLMILHLNITNRNPTNSYHVQKQSFRCYHSKATS